MNLDTALVHRLSDADLLASTRRLVADERAVTADLLVLLGEVEARRLHLDHACSSLFTFCIHELGFSEDAAYTRITVARLARRLPAVVDTVRSGRVHLTGLRLLAPHLDEGNHEALLAEAAGKSKREVEVMVARIAPKPPVPAFIRKLPAPRQVDLLATAITSDGAHLPADCSEMPSAPPLLSGPCGNPAALETAPDLLDATAMHHASADTAGSTAGAFHAGAGRSASLDATTSHHASTDTSGSAAGAFHAGAGRSASLDATATPGASAVDCGSQAGAAPAAAPAASPRPAAHRALVQPLSEETYRVQFTASRGLRDKLREAQDLLGHQLPDGDLATLMERAVDLLLADVKKKRFGLGRKPRAKAEDVEVHDATSRHVPAAIARAVYERDDGRCAFVDERGRRCEETGGLELDHVDGYARTRAHMVEGIRLACRAHNQHAANTLYGRDFMHAARARATRLRESRSGTGDNTPHLPPRAGAHPVPSRDETIREPISASCSTRFIRRALQ